MGNKHNDDLDRLIDDALPGYSEAAPRPGLEHRVRNRIRIAETGRRRFRFLLPALAVAALLLLVIVLQKPQTAPNISPEISRVAHASSPPVEARPAAIRPQHGFKVAVKRTARTRPLPKRQLFPEVAPLTGPERALLSLVEKHPVEARQLIAALQKQSTGPIDIQAIQIQPLPSGGEQ